MAASLAVDADLCVWPAGVSGSRRPYGVHSPVIPPFDPGLARDLGTDSDLALSGQPERVS